MYQLKHAWQEHNIIQTFGRWLTDLTVGNHPDKKKTYTIFRELSAKRMSKQPAMSPIRKYKTAFHAITQGSRQNCMSQYQVQFNETKNTSSLTTLKSSILYSWSPFMGFPLRGAVTAEVNSTLMCQIGVLLLPHLCFSVSGHFKSSERHGRQKQQATCLISKRWFMHREIHAVHTQNAFLLLRWDWPARPRVA